MSGFPGALICVAAMALAGGCASRPGPPEAPIIQPASGSAAAATAARLDALLPIDALLIGEQHDAAEHQQIAQQVIARLAARGLLGALVLEMADAGVSTAALQPSASEEQARHALKWNDKAWPWTAYGPAVMTAVRAGVPVLGANLPRAQMQGSMDDSKLDVQLPGPALKAQQQLIRISHCNLLPESQITPMTRVQIARDISMAHTLSQAALPGKVVVLLAGSGHVDRHLGVPQHLPAEFKVSAVRLRAGNATPEKADAFDSVWGTPALPATDYCASLK
ncbi:MAG: ChaN family lipoprotein [Polaromonas sp.]|uniref:ChaN family lipoprotein n=1 Tax=Polaromonas sp. TaxID=1869339 RepID=UPI002735CCC9|nr:ChaN family lipoprotein [Polaromonas sp.]MDP3795604.1 ChaN family lipoprotein [Polaromonas sp.]